jgi:hypothetical protein
MAPFWRRPCPVCRTETVQHWLTGGPAELDPGERMRVICESCLTALTCRADGSVGQRAATDAERDAVPPAVVWPDEQRAEWRGSVRRGKADLRAWVLAGYPGLTPELEAALPPGARERIRRFAELPGDLAGPERRAEPGAAADGGA